MDRRAAVLGTGERDDSRFVVLSAGSLDRRGTQEAILDCLRGQSGKESDVAMNDRD